MLWCAVWVFLALCFCDCHALGLKATSFPVSFLELGFSGWGPKMTSSFDVEAHAWKPPWFHDGVKGVYVEPFPSYLWLKNGLAVPLMNADKYIFQKSDLEALTGKGAATTEEEVVAKEPEKKEEKDEKNPGSDEPDYIVGGVNVKAAKDQYRQMKEYGLSPESYIPGSIVGQEVFNDWWKHLHQKQEADSLTSVANYINSWFIPHSAQHTKQVSESWRSYFQKLFGISETLSGKSAEAIQNRPDAVERRNKFWYKPLPPGECFNIGASVVCTPIVRDQPLTPPPVTPKKNPNSLQEGGSAAAEQAIAMYAKAQPRPAMGVRLQPHEHFDQVLRKQELIDRREKLQAARKAARKAAAKDTDN